MHETINKLRNIYMSDVGSEDTSQAESSVLANQEPSMYFQGPRCRSSSFLQSSTKYKLKLKYYISILLKNDAFELILHDKHGFKIKTYTVKETKRQQST